MLNLVLYSYSQSFSPCTLAIHLHNIKSKLKIPKFADFNEFQTTIDGIIDSITINNKAGIIRLIVEKVQLFNVKQASD